MDGGDWGEGYFGLIAPYAPTPASLLRFAWRWDRWMSRLAPHRRPPIPTNSAPKEPPAMGSVDERRGSVEIERERTSFGFHSDLGGQAVQSFHGLPVEQEVEEGRDSRWVNPTFFASSDDQ